MEQLKGNKTLPAEHTCIWIHENSEISLRSSRTAGISGIIMLLNSWWKGKAWGPGKGQTLVKRTDMFKIGGRRIEGKREFPISEINSS